MSFDRGDLVAGPRTTRRTADAPGTTVRRDAAPPPAAPEVRERLLLAERYFEAGRLNEADSLCREALLLGPEDAEALRLGAMLAHAAHREIEALELIDRGIEVRPRLTGGHRIRGTVLQALGRPEEALAAFREATAFFAGDAQAWFGMGESLRSLERGDEALLAYQESLRLEPALAEALLSQGVVLVSLGRTDEGLQALQAAARIRPDLAPVQDHLGLALGALGRWDEAVEAYRRAIALDSTVMAAYCHLGGALFELARYLEAVDALQAALALEPHSPDAHNRMGMVLRGLGYLDQAISAHRQALAGRPDFPEAHFNLGVLLAELGRHSEALASFRAALAFRPDFAGAQAHMGAVLLKLGRSMEAITAYRHALGLEPGHADTWYQLGNAMREERRPREAVAAYDRAIVLRPDFAEARHQRGLVLLALGEYAQGWPGFEWRGRIGGQATPARQFESPRWTGDPLQGRTILVHADTGIAETLRFARYLPLVAARGGRVVLECPGTLRRFLEAMPCIAQAVTQGERLPIVHCHAALASLPGLFTSDAGTLPSEAPYLPTRIWSTRVPLLPAGPGLRAGIAWSGRDGVDPRAAIGLATMAPLFGIPDVTWYSLESADVAMELRQLPAASAVHDLAPLMRDVADTAALMAQFDLVVAVDGPIAELAGGLGVELWTMLAAVPAWQWGSEGQGSAWYPTARLFRQSYPGGWAIVVDEIRRLLTGAQPG